jgi:hypothetical protein
MRWPTCLLAIATAVSLQAQGTKSTWVLDNSTLTYRITHPVHEIEGTSHAAKGKGICQAGFCEFLVADPVKTFDSGDTNRDLHMLQAVRGAEFPVVTVRFRIPESATMQPTFQADLEVSFAGQTAHFGQVRFDQTVSGQEHKIVGTVPATVKDFKIDPPRFLTVPIRNEIPVKVETTWHLQQ